LITRSLHLLFSYTQSAPTYIYTLSLHDALPISYQHPWQVQFDVQNSQAELTSHRYYRHRIDRDSCHRCVADIHMNDKTTPPEVQDRKSTRLNSSHVSISYAVFCLKKKNEQTPTK